MLWIIKEICILFENNNFCFTYNFVFQSDVKQAMHIFEESTKLVSLVDMFSDNENFDEIPTENIKYFLLPALLGTLTTKICNADDRSKKTKCTKKT